MQFVRFENKSKEICYGTIEGEKITQIEGSIFGKYVLTDVLYRIDDVELLYPCVPQNLYCVGLNFAAHIQELDLPTPEKPANFMKPVTGVVNPGEAICRPKVTKRVDYEGEMALVIKDKIKNVTPEEALQHVLGVTPLNDVTERMMSYNSTQVTYSKSFDSFTSFGPVIDTDIDPENAIVRTYLNGDKVQEGYTSDFVFSCAHIVSYFSQGRTLYPGDIISTGTPSNVQPMMAGDIVEVEIEGIELRCINPVEDEK